MLEITAWQKVATPPSLAPEQIHVWRFNLAGAEFQPAKVLEAWLSADERRRAARYLHAADAARFRLARSLVRWVLASYTGLPLKSLVFAYGLQGKPTLAGLGGGLEFNLSHCGGLALLAVARELPLGVDLERVRPRAQLLGIARRVFSAEVCRELEALAPEVRLRRFYHYWTALEARVKAQGDGVFQRLRKGAGESWPLRHWCPAPNHLAALAAPSLPDTESDWAWLEPAASALGSVT